MSPEERTIYKKHGAESLTSAQVKTIRTLISSLNLSDDIYRDMLAQYQVKSCKELFKNEATDLISALSKLARRQGIKNKKRKPYGTGERGAERHLTDEQAERIEILRLLNGWDNMRLNGFLYRQTGELRAVQMLMNYQATKVITGMTKVFAGTSRRNFLELNNHTNRQLKDLYERLQRNKTEVRANNG